MGSMDDLTNNQARRRTTYVLKVQAPPMEGVFGIQTEAVSTQISFLNCRMASSLSNASMSTSKDIIRDSNIGNKEDKTLWLVSKYFLPFSLDLASTSQRVCTHLFKRFMYATPRGTTPLM